MNTRNTFKLMVFTLSLSLGIVLMTGCKNNTGVTLNAKNNQIIFTEASFPAEKQFMLKDIANFDGEANNLIPIDSLIAISVLRGKYLINIYSGTSGKVIKNCFPKSETEGISSFFKFGLSGRQLWSYDVIARKVRFIPLEDLFNGSLSHLKNIPFTTKLCYNIIPLKNGFVASGDIESSHKLSFFDSTGRKVAEKGEFNGSFPDGQRFFYKRAFTANINVRPDQKMFTATYLNSDVIEIYKSDGTLLKALHGPENFNVSPSSPSDANNGFVFNEITKMAYVNCYVTQNRIYVLYSGKKIDELYTDAGHKLFVFDWNGKPISQYRFDDPFLAFGVTNDDLKLYAISSKRYVLMTANL